MSSPLIVSQNPNSIFADTLRTHIPVDKLAMKRILDSPWDYNYADSPEWCAMMRIPASNGMTACQHLQMLYKQVKNKTTNNLYCKLEQKGIGRAYYEGAISLASLPRNVRQALQVKLSFDDADELEYEELLFDYDIDNAHPNILLNVCKKADIDKKEYSAISKYCKNREKFLAAIKDCFFKNEEDGRNLAKTLILKAFNQGSISAYLHKRGIDYGEVQGTTGLNILEKIQKQVKAIFNKHFLPVNEAFYNECKVKKSKEVKNGDKHAPFRSFVARTLQHLECEIMEGVLTKLMKLKKIKKNRFDYAFDGFIVPEKLDPKLLNGISKELGWDLTWSVKEPTEGIDLWTTILDDEEDSKEPIKHPKEALEFFDDEHFKTLNLNHKKLKDYFEKFYTFVKNPEPMFVFGRYKSFVNGKTGKTEKQYVISYMKEAEVKKCYKNIHSRIEITKKGEKKYLFIDDYMEDINMVKKEEIEFFPQNTNKPKAHNKRYLNTFTGYNDICFEKGIKLDAHALKKKGILHRFMMVVKNLVGGREERKIFLYLLAYKIKYPARKLPFAVLIKGHQGSGKNTILEQLAKIIGEAHYNTTANLKDITGDYAEGMMNKLLVNLNEINFNDAKGKADLLKSLISENRMSFNVKYCRPIVQNVYAMIVATTNNVCSMKLDIVSGERRWFIFESNGKNKKLCAVIDEETGKNGWDAVHKEWEKPQFIQQLYLYLMSLPIEKFNFQQAQYKMAATPAYNRLASYFVPNMALMLKDFILLNAYKHIKDGSYYQAECMIDFEEPKEEEVPAHYVVDKSKKQKKKEYYEEDDFYKVFKCKSKDLHNWYRGWYDKFGGNADFQKNAKKFQNSIMALSLKSINKEMMSGNNVGFVFKPYSVIRELNELKLINVDITKWRNVIEYDDDESEDEWDF